MNLVIYKKLNNLKIEYYYIINIIYKMFFCLCPCLRKYRKIPKNLNIKELSQFYPNINKGRVIKVYDGDSITIAARIPILKNNTIYKFNIRLNRIDTPELRTSNPIEKEYAIKIRDRLSEKIMNKMVNIKVLKTDKYGRYLAEVSYKKLNINDWLINNGYAINYNGGTKNIFNPNNFNKDLSEDVAVAISLTPENPNYNRTHMGNAGSLVKIDVNIDEKGSFEI